MNYLNLIATICLGLIICLVTLAQAGGDKSAKTTVITLAGGGDKQSGGNYIPIPIPVCSGRGFGGYGGHGHGHGHGHGGHGYGAQSRMGWRR